MSEATLIAHCGATKVSREELKMIPVPESTRTFKPIPHHEIVSALAEALSFRYIGVVRDEYAVSADGMRMFGVLDLEPAFDGGRFAIAHSQCERQIDASWVNERSAGVRLR